MSHVTEAQQRPAVEETIPGTLKRAKSYAEELVKVSQETLEQIAQDKNSPLRRK
jgi:hypothetical protein